MLRLLDDDRAERCQGGRQADAELDRIEVITGDDHGEARNVSITLGEPGLSVGAEADRIGRCNELDETVRFVGELVGGERAEVEV